MSLTSIVHIPPLIWLHDLVLLCLGVQNPVADEAQIYVFIVAHLVTVAVELDNELLVAAIITISFYLLWRFIQKKNNGRCVAGNLRRISDFA